MTPQELLTNAKPHLTRFVTGQNKCSEWTEEVTDMFHALAEVGAGRPRTVLAALQLLKRATGANDLREWQNEQTDQAIRQAFDTAAALPPANGVQ